MDIREIKYVLAVAKRKSFSDAAKRLFVSQSALSQSISVLESKLGVKLFNRSTRSVSLTPAGTVFVPLASEVIDAYERLQSAMEEITAERSAEISVGLFSQSAHSVFPSVIARFIAETPHYHVNFSSTNEKRLIEGVEDGTFDFCFIRCYEQMLSGISADKVPLFDDEIYVLLHRDDPLAGKTQISTKEIEAYRLICEKDSISNSYEALDSDFKERGASLSRPMVYTDNASLIPSVLSAPGSFAFTTKQSSISICRQSSTLVGLPYTDGKPVTSFLLSSKAVSPKKLAAFRNFVLKNR